LGNDEDKLRYKLHWNKERRESPYSVMFSKIWHCWQHFTDRSVLENRQAAAGFAIPDFKTKEKLNLEIGISINTAELIAVWFKHFV